MWRVKRVELRAKGMVGTALVNNLKNIRDNKNRTRPELHIEEIYEYDMDSSKLIKYEKQINNPFLFTIKMVGIIKTVTGFIQQYKDHIERKIIR